MRLLSIYKGEDKTLRLRLFNPAKPEEDLHLDGFAKFIFGVFEKGITDPIISKSDSDISLSTEKDSSIKNIINIKILNSDTNHLKANPSTEDRVRTFTLFGIDEASNRILLETGFFYVEDMAALI